MGESDQRMAAGDSLRAADTAGDAPQKSGDAREPEPGPGRGIRALLGALQGRLLLAALSGLLGWAIMYRELPGGMLLAGALFGALVLMPVIAAPRHADRRSAVFRVAERAWVV